METRFLGNSGLEVSVFGFGAMSFGSGKGIFGAVGATAGEAAQRQIDLCLDAGVTLFDTADIYDTGESEEVLGAALGNRRKNVVVATKAFFRMGEGDHDVGLSRRHLVSACEGSLRRLGTDWIDLYQVHAFDGRVPLDETLRALDDLVTAGKVRYIGSSNYSGWHLMKAVALSDARNFSRFIGQQIQYSLMVRDAEQELLPCGIDQGVGAIIWSPLAQGFLSGKFRDPAGHAPARLKEMGRLESLANERGDKVLDALFEIAGRHEGATPSQVALNWVASRPGVSSVLIGARTDEQLLDNLAARTWALDSEEIKQLDQASRVRDSYPNNHRTANAAARNPRLFD